MLVLKLPGHYWEHDCSGNIPVVIWNMLVLKAVVELEMLFSLFGVIVNISLKL